MISDDKTFLYAWIDAHAALAHLGIGSLTALYRLIDDHGLPFGRVGRKYRFRRIDLDEWVAGRGQRVLRKPA